MRFVCNLLLFGPVKLALRHQSCSKLVMLRNMICIAVEPYTRLVDPNICP